MQLMINFDAIKTVISSMNSKTIPILGFLIDSALKNNNEIKLVYKDIETALGIGRTSVGQSMRLLLKNNIINKKAAGVYALNSDYINLVSVNKVF